MQKLQDSSGKGVLLGKPWECQSCSAHLVFLKQLSRERRAVLQSGSCGLTVGAALVAVGSAGICSVHVALSSALWVKDKVRQ